MTFPTAPRSADEAGWRIDAVKAVRAVGAANGANPIAIIVPCHRVIGANGSLTGFGGGLPVKRALLDLEQESAALLHFRILNSEFSRVHTPYRRATPLPMRRLSCRGFM
ncbi:MAG: MGMT family protein [Vicinamibacterales bacterium]